MRVEEIKIGMKVEVYHEFAWRKASVTAWPTKRRWGWEVKVLPETDPMARMLPPEKIRPIQEDSK